MSCTLAGDVACQIDLFIDKGLLGYNVLNPNKCIGKIQHQRVIFCDSDEYKILKHFFSWNKIISR